VKSMTPAKIDRRTARTRAALMQAFIAILLEEGYQNVTVEQVVGRANVGRSTFYMHFSSKEDILRKSIERPSSVLSVLVGNELPQGVLVKQMEHFHEQRRRNHVFFAGPVRTIWVNCLGGLIERRLGVLARHARARPAMPLSLAALQIAESQIGLIANWLTVRPATKADAIADAMIVSTRALVSSLLGIRNDQLRIPGERLQIREG
jgi:AcrR family transcriptional regulator